MDPSFPPSDHTFDLLSLPASFIPAPRSRPHRLIRQRVRDFLRKLQWSAALPDSEPPILRLGPIPSTRWPPRALVPASTLSLCSRILGATNTLLRSDHHCHLPNLSPEQKQELARLQSPGSSIIKPSDKGGKWVILPASHYHLEALSQLQNPRFYHSATTEPTRHITARLKQLLSHLRSKKAISTREYRYLLPPSAPRPRRFYLLPKLHKTTWPSSHMAPGRPIVTDIDSPSRKCSDHINFFLLPLCALQPSYLKDSGHLIAILRSVTLNTDALLFTMDVEALYTNIPLEEGIQAVAEAFRRHPSPERPDLSLLTLLRLILSSNFFHFGDTLWRQSSGVAMGNPFGGAFANIFMASWESQALDSYPLRPLLWRRYQDDIFGIWTHGEAALKLFHSHLNSIHANIKTTLDFGPSVHFLDLSISISNNLLSFSLFSKDTDTHLILPPSSYHPPHTFRGVVFSEILRYATHSSSQQDFQASFSSVSPIWRSQGFTRSIIRSTKSRVLAHLNLDPSWSPGMFPCHNIHCSVCSHAVFTNFLKDPLTHTSYPIHCRYTCNSRNTIYIIKCTNCPAAYVGETSKPIKQRILEHLHDIRNNRPTNVARHFSSSCRLLHLTFLCIDSSPSLNRRRAKETRWIRALRTLKPLGLNAVSSSAPKTTNLILPYSTCSKKLASTIRRICGPLPMRVSYTRDKNLRDLLS